MAMNKLAQIELKCSSPNLKFSGEIYALYCLYPLYTQYPCIFNCVYYIMNLIQIMNHPLQQH